MGDILSKIGSGVTEAVFPKVPIPERVDPATGQKVSMAPEGTTSYVDRAMPLLGAIGSTLESGNPVSGYVRGRAYQQDVARPYLQMQAEQQANAAMKQQRLGEYDAAIEQARKAGNNKLVDRLTTLKQVFAVGAPPGVMTALVRDPAQGKSAILYRARDAARQAGENPEDPVVQDKYVNIVTEQDRKEKEKAAAARQASMNAAITARQGVVNTEFEMDQAAAKARLAKKPGANPDDPAQVAAEVQVVQAEKAATVDRAKASVKADLASNMSVDDYLAKHSKSRLYNIETGRPVQGLTPVSKQVQTGKVLSISVADEKDLRDYAGIKRQIVEAEKALPAFEKYLDENPNVKSLANTPGWLTSQAAEKYIQSDPRAREFVSKLNLLTAMKSKQVYGARQSDFEQKRLAGYYGMIGLGTEQLKAALTGARETVDNYIGEILTITPEDRDMMGLPPAGPQQQTPPVDPQVHGFTKEQLEAAEGQ